MKNIALIMAAGTSTRCGFDKLTHQLHQQTVLQTTLQTFQNCEAIDEIWIVGKDVPISGKIKGSIAGGNSRFVSVKAGILHCENVYDENVRIIVHNAANPHLLLSDLTAGLEAAVTKLNLIFGFFTPNAIKQVSDKGIVNNFIDREQIFETQTPQISSLKNFTKALQALPANQSPLDEAELLAVLEEPIQVFECDPSNTKITYASDFKINKTKVKLGLGEDSHRFAPKFIEGKPLRLGGIDVSGQQLSSDGNSDGDIILHALCNALLSACGDKTFDPIAAPICAAGETQSTAYLLATLKHLEAAGHTLELHQVLISIEGLRPKIAPVHDDIVSNLATLLDIAPSKIGLTYTTGEGLNAYGRGEGLRAYVLIQLEA